MSLGRRSAVPRQRRRRPGPAPPRPSRSSTSCRRGARSGRGSARTSRPPSASAPAAARTSVSPPARAPHVAPDHGVEAHRRVDLRRLRHQRRLQGGGQRGQLRAHSRCLRRRHRPHAAFRAAAQQLEGQQAAAERQVEHHAVALQAGRGHDAVAFTAQPAGGVGQRPLQPAVQLALRLRAGVGQDLAAAVFGALPGGREVGFPAAPPPDREWRARDRCRRAGRTPAPAAPPAGTAAPPNGR